MQNSKHSSDLPEGIDIKPRKMTFKYPQDIPKYWCRNDPVPTHFFHALSLLFPQGERFFMDSVRNYENQILDPILKKQIKGFLAQEALHSKEHDFYNNDLTKKGFSVAWMDRRLKRVMDLLRKFYPKRFQLAVTCALEHYTAIMAHLHLTVPEIYEGLDPFHAELWNWHAIEETEHKAVAFDVYKATGGGYLTRVLIMLSTSVGFFLETQINYMYFIIKDKLLFSPKFWFGWVKWAFFKPGLYRLMLPLWLDYFRPSFHPWDLDNSHLVAEWKSKHPEPHYYPAASA